ncbi:GNAT family N-acetyltransferase [Legionella jordanis]|uniref:TDP-fucosamine acetyltransferase n=1 Tax=Legionella jordanis TaxID=456 RepID=A0A0W0VGR3_9GAMM|nr:GNAT family N-acetyltransferase [Legionella jordanis]KTD18950.1 TDP-fucosamine acetyltransferase [Legionella jordanis]RMX05487.1 GNAT family N-acetyltransferase [Legionella jordanis]RMX19172.1 GNAT family N-acetyltransferase [Legionella jordanis]VEH13050.1 TDP-fucosamine acetyltransferase [Legionella jordanis]
MHSLISGVDTKRFGFNVAKVQEWGASPQELMMQLKDAQVKLIISRLPSERVETINQLEDLGFQLKDSQLTYKFDLHRLNLSNLDLPSHLHVREASEADLPSIGVLAKLAFKDYGHYANNARLDKSKVDEIYEDWAVSSFSNKDYADKFFIISSGEDVAGFLTFKLCEQNGKKFTKGGIGAVSDRYRNQGIFKLLNKQGLLWAKELGLDWVEHNALTTNYSVGRVFTSLGFYNAASYVTLHCWLD